MEENSSKKAPSTTPSIPSTLSSPSIHESNKVENKIPKKKVKNISNIFNL